MKCRILDFERADWTVLDQFPDRTVFQTREWLRFVAESQKAMPVLVRLEEDGQCAGYFSGLVASRFGVKVLGSSFPGWTTPYMGFNMVPGASRSGALAAVERLAWDTLKCLHLEVSDPAFTPADGKSLGFSCGYYTSYRTDLRKTEKELFDAMDSACRRCVRKAEKTGVTLEEAHGLAFADEYYAQLKDVFAKQKLVPTYGVDRVRSLIKHLEPAGRVLLLRARDPEGNCIATGIFPGFNRIAEFWGNASFRSGQIWRPNEYMQWYVMRYWKQRGAEVYDWGGEGEYKEKYGCVPHRVPWFTKSRHQIVGSLRNGAKRFFAQRQRVMGWLASTNEVVQKESLE